MKTSSHTRTILLVAALQFVYLVDFMMLLPLGPDLAQALAFPVERLGWLTAAYTLASVLSGLLAVRLLDRFDRKSVLLCAFGAVGLATLAATCATGLWTLLLARGLTGFFGGPAIAVGMAIVIDITPPEQRGRAIAKVMLGFSLAAIAGVPLALELARSGSWRAPFYVVAALATLVWLALARWLPSLRGHLGRPAMVSPRSLLAQPAMRAACLVQAASQFSAFLVIPHFSAYFLLNLGFPRERLGLLYCAGGLVALLTVQLLGRLADRAGPFPAVALASISLCAGLMPFFGPSGWPLMLFFVLFMAGNAGRNVSLAAALSQVPAAHERAGFMSLQSMVQDLAIACAALLTSLVLGETADGRLTGMGNIALLAAAVALAVLWALLRLPATAAALAPE